MLFTKLWFVLLGVIVVQPWFYQLAIANFFLAFLLVTLALLLTLKNKKSLILLIVLSLGIFIWSYSKEADKELWVVTTHDVIRLNLQRSAFPGPIGKFFINKPIFIWEKIEGNLSYNFDLNQLFFSSHPRERLGILEMDRLQTTLLPFFLLGIYFACQKRLLRVFGYGLLAVIFGTLITPFSALGPIFLFPISCFLISLGIQQLLLKIPRFKK